MNDSFTRSLYIGRDKAQEVARRREIVEKELKARFILIFKILVIFIFKTILLNFLIQLKILKFI